MEDIKKIQEFFSKPVKENSRRSPDFILTDPAEIKYTESFGSGIKAPGVLHHANEGAFLGAEGAYIIVLPGGTFYVDEDKEEAIRIYPLKDQSREFQLALDYTPFSPKYETWKSWIKEPETLGEVTKSQMLKKAKKGSYPATLVAIENGKVIAQEKVSTPQEAPAAHSVMSKKYPNANIRLEDSTGKILEEAYIVTYAKNKGEKPASAAYKLRGSALAFMRDLEKDGYTVMLTQRPVDGVDEALEGAYSGFVRGEEDPDSEPFNPTGAVAEFKEDLRSLFGKFKGDLKNPEFIKGVAEIMVNWKSLLRSQLDGVDEALDEYNTGLYYDPAKERNAVKAKEASKSSLEKVKDMIQKVLKEEEGYSKFLKTDDNPEGKTKGLDTKTMNKILMNVIKDLDELKQLGEGVIEEELCPKGKAYIKKRQAAGEKSSAYLSGRAVKVCKGQMKG